MILGVIRGMADIVGACRRMVAIIAAAVATMVTLAGCDMFASETLRYRLTVEVETPKGLRSGSSVIESRVKPSGPLSAVAVNYTYRGEAVAVDLPGGQTLFALLTSETGDVDAPNRYPAAAFADRLPKTFPGTYPWLESHAAIRKLGGTGELIRSGPDESGEPRNPYPLLVRFRDLADPASVEAVDPDDLAASFGPGYRLRRITVQITDDPVTTGIEKRLGWVRTVSKKDFPPKFQPPGIPVGDFVGLFSKEISQ